MTADDIIAAARACLGTPFRHQGRQPGVGLDCAGLMVAVCQALGIPCEDVDGYGRRPHGALLESALDAQSAVARIPVSTMRPGDVLLMRFKTDPQHLALHAGSTIIHAYEAPGRVVEHQLDAAWRARIVRAYRFREVTQ